MNNTNKVVVREITKFRQGVDCFVDTVFDNFSYLKNSDQLGHNKKEIRNLLMSSNMISYLVYNNENKIIGYLLGENKLLNDGRNVYYITYIYVGENFRHVKIGSKLMNLLINKCKYKGIKFIVLTCDLKNTKVLDFYKRLGFIPDPILKNYGRHEVYTLYL